MTTKTNRFGSFRLKSLKMMNGPDGNAFSAELVLDGKTVANVGNTGNGGCHDWYWMDKDAQSEFHDLAVAVAKVPVEEDDSLIWDLIEATRMNRKKTLLVLLPVDGDFWDVGQYRTVSNKGVPDSALREKVLAQDPGAKFWDSNLLEFV